MPVISQVLNKFRFLFLRSKGLVKPDNVKTAIETMGAVLGRDKAIGTEEDLCKWLEFKWVLEFPFS